MADNNMKIILEMIDKASPEFRKANANVISDVKKLETQTKQTAVVMDNSLRKSAQEFSRLRSSIIPITAALGTIIATTKEWAKVNENTSRAYTQLEFGIKSLSQNIGSLLAPTITALADLVKATNEQMTSMFDGLREAYGKLFDKMTFAIQYITAFVTAMQAGQGIFEAHNIAANVAGAAVEEMGEKFRETMTTINEGYSQLANAERQLDEFRQQLSDEDSLRKRMRIEEDIAFLKHYEATFRQAQQGMAAFAVAASSAFQQSFSSSFTSIVMGTKKVSEGFKEMGQAMLQSIVAYFTKMMASQIAAFVLEKTILSGKVAASTAAMAATTAAGVAQGAALTAAYTPAAIAANIASFGGAAVAAAATFPMAGAAYASSMAAATAAAQGLGSGAAALGGGAGRSISVDMLSVSPQAKGGDYMVNKPTLFLAGEAGPERATFTPIGKTGGGGGGYTEININVDNPVINNTQNIDYLVEEISRKLALEVERIR